MVHETPSPCRFRCVGVAFAVIAEGCPANKLPCVIAFVCGMLSANTALHCGVLVLLVFVFVHFRPLFQFRDSIVRSGIKVKGEPSAKKIRPCVASILVAAL